MNDTRKMIRSKKSICKKDNRTAKIELATQTLDRNIGFINSCDSKTSIVLALVGVLLTIILTNNGLSVIFSIVNTCLLEPTFCDILFILIGIFTLGLLAFGIWKLICVLIAKTDVAANNRQIGSRIFFEGIVKTGDLNSFKESFISMTDADLLDDLISQIYINAEIVSLKYKNYKRGLKCTVYGFLLLVSLLLIGVYIY